VLVESSRHLGVQGLLLLPYTSVSLPQVSELLAASNFQRHSGPTLESLTMHLLDDGSGGCFDFSAPPKTYPVGRLPCALVPVLLADMHGGKCICRICTPLDANEGKVCRNTFSGSTRDIYLHSG
jgi:hypothetical protein